MDSPYQDGSATLKNWSNIMKKSEALSVVDHRPLVPAGLAAVDYAALATLSEHRV